MSMNNLLNLADGELKSVKKKRKKARTSSKGKGVLDYSTYSLNIVAFRI